MGELERIPFDQESSEIKTSVRGYWKKRAAAFSSSKQDEAQSYKGELWKAELNRQLPQKQNLQILDVGCGAGFFELLLSSSGHQITGIDLSAEMIEEAKKLAAENGSSAEFLVMDAEHPDFPDEIFDIVLSRNLTWTLPHPDEAYRQWHRVLKPGGVLLNFDAEYAKGFHQYDQAENYAHSQIDEALVEECHKIYHMLSISSLNRPEWDRAELEKIGFVKIRTDLTVGDRLYGMRDQFYMPDRMFSIRAVKEI